MQQVVIHHPKTKAQATVPESVYTYGLKAQGWKKGKLPTRKTKES